LAIPTVGFLSKTDGKKDKEEKRGSGNEQAQGANFP